MSFHKHFVWQDFKTKRLQTPAELIQKSKHKVSIQNVKVLVCTGLSDIFKIYVVLNFKMGCLLCISFVSLWKHYNFANYA